MLILLPPSETKRDGGEGAPLDYAALAHPRLNPRRRGVVRRLRALARTPDEMMRRLKLGPKLAGEVDRNRAVTSSPTMAAMDRYTGVLYEALDAPTLDGASRERAGERLRIHSALFGLVGGFDPIPAYRLSHDSRLEGETLRATWAAPVSKELAAQGDQLVLDLRSEGYVGLGPVPPTVRSHFLRVVTTGDDGVQRALNHFNKKGKGELARALVQTEHDLDSVDDLIAWGAVTGFALSLAPDGELLLEV
ncbi:peroxide stress protein YaaA [Herbiconiux moechotypicola]|uniref:Peroxide stress protein YaaA n=1 Tax=Herbiconiux moechotypicola TaxID=637393 RepID=A0ABN3D814_9MICO|nr:peroxide stress protein YaaA [Herbiconiux moechotypicola]MCS5728440.1 peroxide stress protein YaaA [Herbiconiux moechotypicola]